MDKVRVIVLLGIETVAFAETNSLKAVPGIRDIRRVSGIGGVGREKIVLACASPTVTLTGLTFTNSGLEALGGPTDLCLALNGREFNLKILIPDKTTQPEYRCRVANAGDYAGIEISKSQFETVVFSILGD
jgi:hypothetical protein